MDLQEFKETFEGEVIEDPRLEGNVLKCIRTVSAGICGIDGNGFFAVRDFDDYPMDTIKLYEPTKPEFDFKVPGFWGNVYGDSIRYFDKAGLYTWLGHDKNGRITFYSKKQILENVTPCNPPKDRNGWEHILDVLEEYDRIKKQRI